MEKYIVLSVNGNPDYLYFLPIACWAWKKFGWSPIVLFNGNTSTQIFDLAEITSGQQDRIVRVADIPGYRSDTITQVSRLYAECVQQDGYLMTGDIDMIPLSDYWKPDVNKMTVWGWDLTGRTHFPICYIGMPAKTWRHLMNIQSDQIAPHILIDLMSRPEAKEAAPWEKRWFVDQDLITDKMKNTNPVHVLRGQYPNGYASGRVDRGNWTLAHDTLIDAHLPQQVYHKGREKYFEQMMELLHHVWPEEDFGWFYSYTVEFRKLTGHA